jgi:hypothetical protein
MTQGRKSRTVLALACALVALTAVALAPAFAGAQAADNEYNLTLPGANGGGEGNASGGGESPGTFGSGASGSDDGGAPILLIALAAIAAICTVAAIWRLRDRSGGGSGKVGPGAREAASETQ